MRYISYLTAIALAGLMAMPALAQPRERGERGDRPGGEQFRERMLQEFDKDGDGRLSDEERQAMRQAMRERFGRGDRDGARRPEGRRGPRGRERAADRPARPARLEALFNRFDADGDGKLSREEFAKLAEFLRSQRSAFEAGRRFESRRGEGPPRGERRPERQRRGGQRSSD